MTAHDEIRSLLASYCQLCDDGRFDEFQALFTDDAEFSVLGRTHRGPDAIRAFMERAQGPEQRGKHLISEPLIRLDGDATGAACTTDYAFVAHADGVLAITSTGRYVDRVVRVDGTTWRFASRRIVFLGDAA